MAASKNPQIQILRLVAIIAVVMIHTYPGGHNWQVYFRPFVNYAVALFLFLSGYLTKSGNCDWASYIRKRVIRVLVPYVIWTFVYTIPHLTLHDFFYNILTTRAAAPLYYIAVYIQLVLLTPIVALLAESKVRWIGWIISPVSLILFKYLYWFGLWEYNDYVGIVWGMSFGGWFSYYYLGFLLGNGIFRPQRTNSVYISLVVMFLILQIVEGAVLYRLGEVNCGTQMKLSTLFTNSFLLILVYRLIQKGARRQWHRLLILVGDYSFGIYLSHVLFIELISEQLNLSFPINFVLVLGISFAFVYSASKICGYRLSRWIGLT